MDRGSLARWRRLPRGRSGKGRHARHTEVAREPIPGGDEPPHDAAQRQWQSVRPGSGVQVESMSLHVLAMDTTGDVGSLALVGEGGLIQEVMLDSPDGFAHVLFDEIERLLERHALSVSQIDAFAAAAGPGSFTGVRVGLTAAKGLAEASARRVIAVSNLQALAWYGSRQLRAVVLDARRGEVYGGVYDDRLRLVQEEVVASLPVWLA